MPGLVRLARWISDARSAESPDDDIATAIAAMRSDPEARLYPRPGDQDLRDVRFADLTDDDISAAFDLANEWRLLPDGRLQLSSNHHDSQRNGALKIRTSVARREQAS